MELVRRKEGRAATVSRQEGPWKWKSLAGQPDWGLYGNFLDGAELVSPAPGILSATRFSGKGVISLQS